MKQEGWTRGAHGQHKQARKLDERSTWPTQNKQGNIEARQGRQMSTLTTGLYHFCATFEKQFQLYKYLL